MPDLSAVVLVCTLKPSPAESSSSLIGRQLLSELESYGVEGELIRVVDRGVRFGVSKDEGDGDGWPEIRERILAADIVAIASPIWMGQPSSVTKMVLERLDAELSETGAEGRLSMSGKVAVVAVVGNEDGAHHVIAECLQALNDVGFTIPASAGAYWVGEAMQATDYQDLDDTPEKTQQTLTTAATNAVHLASLLRSNPYPA
jgi:multimeric flavodoxin WrbA